MTMAMAMAAAARARAGPPPAAPLVLAAAATLLLFLLPLPPPSPPLAGSGLDGDASPSGSGSGSDHRRRRRLSSSGRPPLALPPYRGGDLALARFFDPRSVTLRAPPTPEVGGIDGNPVGAPDGVPSGHFSGDPSGNPSGNPSGAVVRRTNCQVIYVLGVEGSIHHGFVPVLRTLAELQSDPVTRTPYDAIKGHPALRSAIFGFEKLREDSPPMDDPDLVRETVERMCPPRRETWKKKVILEGNSFPSGRADNLKLQFRQRRREEWQYLSPEEISVDPYALDHPTNLDKFYESYSPHVDVRFVVLHRPYLETIASHRGFDNGPLEHSNVVSGFLLLLGRFLEGHKYGPPLAGIGAEGGGGGGGGPRRVPLWTVVCADKLSARAYASERDLATARETLIADLAEFLGWPVRSCPTCFDGWRESGKASPEERMGKDVADAISANAKVLEGRWPPRRAEVGAGGRGCRL
ncbi:hypothetical protein ACHAWF_011209 [Thalassiosira exigua]